MAMPSEILKKHKPVKSTDKKGDKEPDNDKDDKKAGKRNALIDFIAKCKDKKE